MKYEEKLEELGYKVPQATISVANYAPGVVQGEWLYVSGQLPMIDGKLAYQGRLGENMSVENGYAAARTCALNGLGVIKTLIGDLDRIEKIIKITGFVSATPEFTDQPKVINGASDLLGQVFGEAGVHARSAVGAAALPLGACCEVEMILKIKE